MFLGEYSHALDAKNRIFIPAKYREELGETFVITKSIDKCLTVYTMPEWEKLKAKLDSLPAAKSRQIKRFMFANAADVSCDSQGRALLSQPLREYAGIDKNTVIIGVGSYLEIWSEENWIRERENENAEEIAQMMEDLDF